MNMQRRYLRPVFHGTFGYHLSMCINIRKEQGSYTRQLHYLNDKEVIVQDLPLAWDSEDAWQFIQKRESFAYLSTNDNGMIVCRFVDSRDFPYIDLAKENIDRVVIDARKYVKEHHV